MTKSGFSGRLTSAVGCAGLAQLVEQLICNQQVGGSSPSTGSTQKGKLHMGEFPSGQRGQTVNLLLIASVVRIHLPPPIKNPPAVLVGLLLVGEDSWIRTHSNPTCRWHVGKTSANTGFLLTAFPRKAGHRIHLPSILPSPSA